MKHYIAILAIIISGLSFVGCNNSFTTYSGGEYIGFADTVVVCPVFDNNNEFEIEVASTVECPYDRVFGVEIVDANTNAIEGVHFKLADNSFTIKAGERSSVIKMNGIYNNIDIYHDLQVQLRLVTPDNLKWDLYDYNQDIKVILLKRCPFDIEMFDNRYCIVQSSLLYEMNGGENKRLIKTYVDRNSKNDNVLILKNFLFDGDIFRDNYDLRLKFETEDAMTPDLSMEPDQIIASTRTIMGQPHGDTWVRTEVSAGHISYYSACEEFAMLNHRCYVNGKGNMGVFWAVLKWISDEEGALIEKEGF